MKEKIEFLTTDSVINLIKSTENTELFDLESETQKVSFLIKGIDKTFSVITSGWHTWSGSKIRGKNVGIGTFEEKFSKKQTEFFIEPKVDNGLIPVESGISYGYIALRSSDGAKNYLLGIIPSLMSVERISFRLSDRGLIVTLDKVFSDERDNKFRLVFSSGSHTQVISEYNKELSSLNKLELMKDRIIWFTWAAYGKAVNQVDVISELPYLVEIGVDSLIIDDGWETTVGQWEIDEFKFPDMIGLVASIKKIGIKPGIWIAPFMTMKESESSKIKSDWVMRDAEGKNVVVTNLQVQPTNKALPVVEKSLGLDISIKEVRDYVHSEIIRLHKIGFEIFKLDFLAIPFMGKLKNNELSTVEYYRLFFIELREKLDKEANGKSIELIGCGAPLFESVGLFEGIRITDDSAMPILDGLQFYKYIINAILSIPLFGKLIRNRFDKLQTQKYSDASAVAFKRALVLKDVHGALVDGVHISDPKIEIDNTEKNKLIEALPAFKDLGLLTSIFVGDSLKRAGILGRLKWKEFIIKFNKGNFAWIDDETGNVLVKR